MLGLGPTELIIILVLVIIIFGAGRLPEIGSALGRGIKEFKSTIKDESETAKEESVTAEAAKGSKSKV